MLFLLGIFCLSQMKYRAGVFVGCFFYLIPNILSLLRIILTPIFMVTFFCGSTCLIFSILIFTFAALTDTFDGYYARKFNAHSSLGAFLDPIADKFLINSTLISFLIIGLVEWWVVGIIVARDFLVTILRVQTTGSGSVFKTSFIAKTKTVAQFLSIYLFFICLFIKPGTELYSIILLIARFFLYGVVLLTIYSGADYFLNKS